MSLLHLNLHGILCVQMTHFDDYIFNELLLEKVEKPFTFSTTNYPTTPTGLSFFD